MQPPYYNWGHMGISKQSCMLLDILNLVWTAHFSKVFAPCRHSSIKIFNLNNMNNAAEYQMSWKKNLWTTVSK